MPPLAVRALAVRAATAAVLVVVAGCARPERVAPPPRDPTIPAPEEAPPEPARPAALQVQNRSRADVVVLAERGGFRTRLGTVTAATTAALTIPATFVNDAGGFHLVADPVGGRAASRTERIVVRTGQHVIWTVESNPARSSVGVY